MNTKSWLKLIPLMNILFVLVVIGHVYLIDVNMDILLVLVALYITITSLIIHKHRILYNMLEMQYSKLALIIMVLTGMITILTMILGYQNFDIVGILTGLAVGMLTHLIHQLICLK